MTLPSTEKPKKITVVVLHGSEIQCILHPLAFSSPQSMHERLAPNQPAHLGLSCRKHDAPGLSRG
jgi:hypothetical protein